VANKSLTQAKPHAPVEPLTGKPVIKPFILLNTVKERKTEHKTMAAPFVPVVAIVLSPLPDKGKGRRSSTMVNYPYTDALSYKDSEWDDFDVDMSAEDAWVRDSLVFHFPYGT